MNNRNSISKRNTQGRKVQTNIKTGFIALAFTLIAMAGLVAWLSSFGHHLRPSGGGDLAKVGAPTTAATPAEATRAKVSESFGKLPLSFIENRGQMDDNVAYYVKGHDKNVYFTAQGLTYVLTQPREREAQPSPSETMLHPASFRPASEVAEQSAPNRWALRLDFVGARPDVRPQGLVKAAGVVSYFKGEKSRWEAGLKTYESIIYRDLWPGIDLVYAGTVTRMKYTFVVKPGADPNQIRLAYRGASEVKLKASGELEVNTPAGGFSDEQPVSYQEANAGRIEVSTDYKLEAGLYRGGQVYGFKVGEYDRSRELVIDPAVLVYCGMIGGSEADNGFDIAVDNAGNAYVTGSTPSDNASFPDGDGFGSLPGPDQSFNGNYDAFVAKINAAGTGLIYAGYIGGSGFDTGSAIAVDSAGSAYVTGYTQQSGPVSFPVGPVGPDLTYNGGNFDAFVAKVNAAGTGLDYCGYIGGTSQDAGTGIAVDGAGNAYVIGYTTSNEASFPDGDGFGALPGPDQSLNGDYDVFVAKINAAGTGLIYAGYIGGSGLDYGSGIAVDGAGSAYVSGITGSDNASFPDGDGFGSLPGLDQSFNGSYDAFVAKINAAGTGLIYAGYIGGSGDDRGRKIAVDSAGNAYITGSTNSDNTSFPDGDGFGTLPGPDQSFNGGTDAFVAKINAAGTGLIYAGYIGGSGNEIGWDIAIDGAGNAYIVGETTSNEASFPDGDGFGALPGPDQTYNGGSDDAFVAKVNAAGTGLIYAGYIGGSHFDIGYGIAVDGAGSAYIFGTTGSDNTSFPDGDGFGTLPGIGQNLNGSFNAFVAKLQCVMPSALRTLNPSIVQAGTQGFTLIVNGKNFDSTSVVRWNGANRPTTLISATEVRAEITAADVAAPGSAAVTVFTPGPCGGISNVLTVTICGGAPFIQGISPMVVSAGGLTFTLTVNGANFHPKSKVLWDGSARQTTFVSATQLKAVIPAADIATPGNVTITVDNGGSCFRYSNEEFLTISGASDQ